jgi:hypothetical protein
VDAVVTFNVGVFIVGIVALPDEFIYQDKAELLVFI